jgi:hypothetical protein
MNGDRELLKERYQKCIVAMEPATGRETAAMVCAQAVYGSRGYNVRSSKSHRSRTHKQTRSRSRHSSTRRRH